MRFRLLRLAAVLFVAAGISIVLLSDPARGRDRRPMIVPGAGVRQPDPPVTDGSPVHDVGNLRLHAPNWGMIGSWPGAGLFNNAPSAEWPAGSNVEYLYVGGLWVGAMLNGSPVVSTSAYEFEFRPTDEPRDTLYTSAHGDPGGSRPPHANWDDDSDGLFDEDWRDGWDNDGDFLVDEDFAAISDQMFSCRFRDDTPAAITNYPSHVPMHLFVREESYAWSNTDYDDFVGFTFWVTNAGTDTLRDVYLGVFADGDVGNPNTPNYYLDDATSFRTVAVNHDVYGVQDYDFQYWFDQDGDNGQVNGYAGIVVLDHPTDPTGQTAPTSVGAHAAIGLSSLAAPTDDAGRYQIMAQGTIGGSITGDVVALVSIGPFAELLPGETLPFSFAFVVTPRGDYTNVENAAIAYFGQWFDLDDNPATGIDGKEHQEHWYLADENPNPVAITSFRARPSGLAVELGWDVWADEDVAGFEILRADGSGQLRPILDAPLSGDRRAFVDDAVRPGASYDYQLIARGVTGWTAVSPRVSVTVPNGAVALRQNRPNPFHASTSVTFTLADPAPVDIGVYDVAGHRVATIASETLGAGEHMLEWNGTGDDGRPVAAGVYFCRLVAGKKTFTRKMLVVR